MRSTRTRARRGRRHSCASPPRIFWLNCPLCTEVHVSTYVSKNGITQTDISGRNDVSARYHKKIHMRHVTFHALVYRAALVPDGCAVHSCTRSLRVRKIEILCTCYILLSIYHYKLLQKPMTLIPVKYTPCIDNIVWLEFYFS